MVDYSNSQSQRVDGGLIVRKQTMIVKNKKAIDEVYTREKKVWFKVGGCKL